MSDNKKLSAKQIKSWREALSVTLGPYAFIMSDEDVQTARDRYQQEIDDQEAKVNDE